MIEGFNYTDSWENRTVDIDDIWMRIGNIFGYYTIPIGSLILSALNFIFCIFVYRLKMKTRFYHLLIARKFTGMLAALISIGFQNFACTFCFNQIYNTYLFHFYRLYVMRFTTLGLLMTGTVFEILLSYER